MADVIYNSFYLDMGANNINLRDDDYKIMLVTSAYTPNIDTHNRRDDITNEVVGAGYAAGGADLVGIDYIQDDTNNLAMFDADDVTWPNSTITARGAVIYKNRAGASSADELVKYFDFASDQTTSNTEFKITFNAGGILQVKTGA